VASHDHLGIEASASPGGCGIALWNELVEESLMSADLTTVLDDLEAHVKSEMECKPEVIDKGEVLDVDALPIEARKWHKATEVVAVVADLKGSTSLGIGKHAASTASIYEASTGGITRIFNDFNADFVARSRWTGRSACSGVITEWNDPCAPESRSRPSARTSSCPS
jgi:hypothetical protein